MPLLPQDERHLQAALALAADAAAFASPNPTVGCVLTLHDRVLGQGAHLYDRRDHAEIAALKAASAAGHDPHGATAFVTLEPCSHHGRTGPCADALIAAGTARCVVATVDPNPLVGGSGIAKLRNAGIEVTVLPPAHPLALQARRLNDAFAWSIQHARPFVTLKAALSADRKLAPNPSQRNAAQPVWLTGEAARADVQHLRHTTDAILTGIGTVLADDPLLTDRTHLPRRRPLLRVVLDTMLRTPPHSRLARSAADDLLLLAGENAPPGRERTLRQLGIDILRLPSTPAGHLDLAAALAALHQRQIRSVLTEAGSALNANLLKADLADHLALYYSEAVLGEDAVPFAVDVNMPDMQTLGHLSVAVFHNERTEDVLYTGYLHDPWQSVDALP